MIARIFLIGSLTFWGVSSTFAQDLAEGIVQPAAIEDASLDPKSEQITAVVTPPIEAKPPRIPTEHLASRSVFKKFEMAPDGSRFAVLRADEKTTQIQIFDAAKLEKLEEWSFGERETIEWFKWIDNERLFYSVALAPFSFKHNRRLNGFHVREVLTGRRFTIPLDRLKWSLGDLVHVAEDGTHALVSMRELSERYPSVYRFDLRSGAKPQKVIRSKKDVYWWHADDIGVVRLGLGWQNKRLKVYYRSDAASKFKLIGRVRVGEEDSRYWEVIQIVSGSDNGYVLEEGENGRVGIRLFDYATRRTIETFYEHPEWDIESMWLDDDGKPLAAFYTDDRERAVWFDREYEELYIKIRDRLGTVDVRFVGLARNGERVLLWAGNEADPGAIYSHARGESELVKFVDLRPELDRNALVKPKPVAYRARDGLSIRAYLTLPQGPAQTDLPLIILPHGGPFGVRDKLEYNGEVQFLANRGYAVLQPNFRGSSGYGQAFSDAGNGQIGRKMQDDLDDAMDWAVSEGIADPERVCVIGGSYGGYAALWAVLRNPERYRCAASWAGVTDLKAMLKYDRLFLTRSASRQWRARVRGGNNFDVRAISPISRAGELNRPVLLAHGSKDYVVPITQYMAFEEESNDAPVRITKLRIPSEGHSFTSEDSEQQWYDALDHFLDKHNPAQN